MNIPSYRPGVYSQYTVRTLYPGRRDGLRMGLVGLLGLEEPLTAVKLTSGSSTLPQGGPAPSGGAGEALSALCKVCFSAGVGELWCVSLPENPTVQDVEGALAALEETGVYAVALQYTGDAAAQAAGQWAQAQSAAQRERLVFIGHGDGAVLVPLAGELNNERVVLAAGAPTVTGFHTAGPLCGAAALAAAVAVGDDPSISLSNLELAALGETPFLSLDACDELLGAGVSPLVTVGDHVECLRAVTTRTTDGALPDRSLYPLNAVLIIDYVMTGLRGTLGGLLKGAKNGGGTLSAVASQVTVLLGSLQQRGIITGFGAPNVYTPGEDPGRCVVEVAFQAAYTINQICITAQVQL